MSIIQSGTGTTSTPVAEIAALRAVGPSDSNAAPVPAAPAPAQPATAAGSSTAIVTSTALAADGFPVDEDRVASIRQAIATNSYPLVPTRIGDAMIAAGLLLRMGK